MWGFVIGNWREKMGEVALLPVVGMVMAECAQAGLIIISKVAMSDGMNNLIFVFYSNLLASPILLLFSFLFYRSTILSLCFATSLKFNRILTKKVYIMADRNGLK